MATNKDNGKVYIGKTIQVLVKRQRVHYSYAKKGSGKYYYFQRAIDKHGKESFLWEVLFTSDNDKLLCQRESLFIALYNSQDSSVGYNICSGGEGSAPNEEFRRRHSEKMKEVMNRPDVLKNVRAARKKLMENPVYLEYHAEKVREACRKPEWQEKHKKVLLELKTNKVWRDNSIKKNKENAKNPLWIKANQKSLDAAHEAAGRRVLCFETGIIYHTVKQTNLKLGASVCTVTEICNGGRKKSSNGYHFRYITEKELGVYKVLRAERGRDSVITIEEVKKVLDKCVLS